MKYVTIIISVIVSFLSATETPAMQSEFDDYAERRQSESKRLMKFEKEFSYFLKCHKDNADHGHVDYLSPEDIISINNSAIRILEDMNSYSRQNMIDAIRSAKEIIKQSNIERGYKNTNY